VSTQAVGLVAGTLTTAAWIPQLARTVRSRSADDLSWSYLLVFAGGVSTWVAYSVLTRDLPVFAANVVSVALILALLQLKGGAALRARLRARRAPGTRPPRSDAGGTPPAGRPALGNQRCTTPRRDAVAARKCRARPTHRR